MRGPSRAWFLLPAGVGLLAGLDAGLLLLGVAAPVDSTRLPDVHGVLMVLGFLGTLVALERAVALRARWGYAAPGLLGAGALALVSPLPITVGQVLLVDGTIGLLAVLSALWLRRRDDAVLVEVLGAALAVMAALLWIRVETAAIVPLLGGFVVLTIAAERVELARIHLPDNATTVLIGVAAAYAVAASIALLSPDVGSRLTGLVLVALVAWLAPRDVARRMVRTSGLPRFSAAAMLGGYVWLGVSGISWLVIGAPRSTGAYDLVVHTLFLGFAMSMVIAHAPVILPAVIRRPLPYRPLLWAPLVVLHAGLLVRVSGDLTGATVAWQAGGVVTVVALLLLPLTAAFGVLAPVRASPRTPPTPTSHASTPTTRSRSVNR